MANINVISERYDSIDSFLRTTEARTENSVFAGRRTCSSKNDDSSFSMTKSFDEAMGLLRNGWEEPLAEIKAGVDRNFKSNAVRNKNRPQTGVVGYAPCVPNAIMGLPNSMIMTEKTPTKVKAVTILFSVSVTAGYGANQILKSGINVLNIVNNLELAGYRVKLDIEFFSSRESGDLCSVRVNVKDWRQPLDLKKLAFPVSHPSMFRRLGFRWLETVPALTNTGYYMGYGSSHFKENYENALKIYKDNKLLTDNEYLITSYLCINSKHDEKKITEACGLSALH